LPRGSSVASLDEASRYLAEAHGERRKVRIGEDLGTGRLDRVLEHEAGDLTCTVEAGIRLSALQASLLPHGQRLSLDPPADPSIGACMALNLSGPLRHRFGAPRDLVLGVTLVLPDGVIVSAGGKVVKNVAGYDLGKLVCGSHGRLALIARVSLRLHPLPAAARTLVVESDDPAGVVRALLRSPLQPSALDVLHPGRVAMLVEGHQAAVDDQLERAIALVGGEEGSAEVWQEVRRRQGEARGRVRFDPGRLAETLAGLEHAVVRPAAGIAYVPQETPSDLPAAARALEEQVRAQFDPAGILS
jgi:glycolate dehydrogenase FAD-binding subunit